MCTILSRTAEQVQGEDHAWKTKEGQGSQAGSPSVRADFSADGYGARAYAKLLGHAAGECDDWQCEDCISRGAAGGEEDKSGESEENEGEQIIAYLEKLQLFLRFLRHS